MDHYLKNLEYSEVLKLADQVSFLPGQVTSKTLVQNPAVGLTLFAMPGGEGISAHKSSGDALVTVLQGVCEISIDENGYRLERGQSIVMPAGHPHAVKAVEDAKMLLVVIFPPRA